MHANYDITFNVQHSGLNMNLTAASFSSWGNLKFSKLELIVIYI